MKWIEVESSQIAAIGYEPEAEFPLGVRFTPNKKQREAGQLGSVYEYQKVTSEMFTEFSNAESKGHWFEANIKKFPNNYPYRRVE